MKNDFITTVIGFFLMMIFVLLFTAQDSFAEHPLREAIIGHNGVPVLVKDLGGTWTNPIKVYSDKKITVYAGYDTITLNLFTFDYRESGTFYAQLYIEIKDKVFRNKFITSIKSNISQQQLAPFPGQPDYFSYFVCSTYFDIYNNTVSLKRWKKYLDRNGYLITFTEVQQEDYSLDNKTDIDFGSIAKGIVSVLNKAQNDPQIASRLPRSDIEKRSEYIRLNPNDAKGYNNRGYKYHNRGDFQLAIKDYDEAIRLEPNSGAIYSNRASTYFKLKNYAKAIRDLSEAIRLDPADESTYRQLRGLAYINQGDRVKGCIDFKKACELGDCRGVEDAKGKGLCN